MLSPNSIDRFKALYEREFGVELTTEEAAAQAALFLSSARVVLRPMPKAWLPAYDAFLEQQRAAALEES